MYVKERMYKKILCNDGFSVSIQAGTGKYCVPKTNDPNTAYEELELGYPSFNDPLIERYAEMPDKAPNTVYPYVPVQTVYLLLTKHGGVDSGECPMGVPVYGEPE